ncbi:hypothetical protein FQN57_004861 [Myotisia sp. PD_48]|nr:hypothetical protein FQN57_004861 [Myotisia sp. PD_48]
MKSCLQRALPPALTLYHPLSRTVLIQTSAQCSSRQFSQCTAREGALRTPKMVKPRIPTEMSMKNRMNDAMSGANRDAIPDDIGLLPGTFVRPVWGNLPSLFSEPRRRWQMEWMTIKMNVQNFISLLAYCKYLNKKVPLRLRERKQKAKDLHQDMYKAFANGNLTSLQSICCAGLSQTFASRISRRSPNSPNPIWTLHQYLKFPRSLTLNGAKVLSDRAAALPGASGLGIRQVVVRIQSRQSLVSPLPAPDVTARSTTQAQATIEQKRSEDIEIQQREKQKDCTEYVVLQRFMFGGVEGDWKVWGLVEETTFQDLDTNPAFATGLSLKDRIQMMAQR